MRKFFALTLLLCAIAVAAKEQPLTTGITNVKVFLSGAEVTRTGKVMLDKGVATLLIAGLSQEVDPANIQVTGAGTFTILGVQHRLNYLEEKQDRTEVVALEAKITALEADIAREEALLLVLNQEDARLAKNDVVAGDPHQPQRHRGHHLSRLSQCQERSAGKPVGNGGRGHRSGDAGQKGYEARDT